MNVDQACRKAGIDPAAYRRWESPREDPASAEQLRVGELEAEVGRLKLPVAEPAPDRRMLREASEKKP